MQDADIAVIGGGIVGLASAYQLMLQFPSLRIVVLEKESDVALHQTGRNSGVLHSGIYYNPGSLKAKNCRVGKAELEAFCDEHDVAYEQCGKVIVAVEPTELPGLAQIYKRGQQNGVTCSLIGADRLKDIEPHAAGIQAIHVPEAGIVDYRGVCCALRQILEDGNAEVYLSFEVSGIEERQDRVIIRDFNRELHTKYVVNCAGLYADRIARMAGHPPSMQILPFRGEYFVLSREAKRYCQGLIYPVPDPDFPFLGVHFTKMVDGHVECGPNAVLAFAREGYTLTQVNWPEFYEILSYRGFRRLAGKHWRQGMMELYRSCSKRAFVNTLQRLIPEIQGNDLTPVPAGVRAMAVAPDGNMVDDFVIQETRRLTHVCNAPSPAATAALAIGRHVAALFETKLA